MNNGKSCYSLPFTWIRGKAADLFSEFLSYRFSFAPFASFAFQLFCFGRIADFGRKTLMTSSWVSMYGPPIKSMQ